MESLSNGSTTKDRIISATLHIIYNEGLKNVKVRKIASLADVNIAAINYHFGSKAIVINEALKHVTVQMKNSFNHLENTAIPAQTRFQKFFMGYLDTALKYPSILKNFVNHSMNNHCVEAEYEIFLKKHGVKLIENTLKEILPNENTYILHMKTLQILSCFALPALLGDKTKKILELDYKDSKTRETYIDLILKSILIETK